MLLLNKHDLQPGAGGVWWRVGTASGSHRTSEVVRPYGTRIQSPQLGNGAESTRGCGLAQAAPEQAQSHTLTHRPTGSQGTVLTLCKFPLASEEHVHDNGRGDSLGRIPTASPPWGEEVRDSQGEMCPTLGLG